MFTMSIMPIATSLFSSFHTSDWFGKLIFLFLFLLSTISWTFIVLLVARLQKWKKDIFFFEQKIEQAKDHLFASIAIPANKHPIFLLFTDIRKKTAEILEKNRHFAEDKTKVFLSSSDISLLENHAQICMTRHMQIVDRNLYILPTIYSLAPFLGLLGTVWGILVTFSSMNMHSAASNNLVLSGLSMALGTTVVGLLIAIPALVGHNYIKNEIGYLKKRMLQFAQNLLINVEMQYRKVE